MQSAQGVETFAFAAALVLVVAGGVALGETAKPQEPAASPVPATAPSSNGAVPDPAAGAAMPAQQSPGDSGNRVIEGFPALRAEVLNMIGTATQRIWLSTDYLTDGEIVSALFIAQYRRISVQVLLGQRKANAYMSRLHFLKAQNIPVWLRPSDFGVKAPTALLIDNRATYIDGELDFRSNVRRYQITSLSDIDRGRFEEAFARASARALEARPDPIPTVGRARAQWQNPPRGGAAYDPTQKRHGAPGQPSSGRTGSAPSGARYAPQEADGAFTYDRSERHPPPHMPRKLPRETIEQRRQAGRPQEGSTVTAPPTEETKP